MKTIKVSEATNTQLDWLVAKCEGAEDLHFNGEFWIVSDPINGSEYLGNLDYTGDWSLMGPIIERERIGLSPWGDRGEWLAYTQRDRSSRWSADSALRAAAGCYVISKLGETVEVPEELV